MLEGGEDTQCGMLLVFPTSIREVILKELVFLEKIYSKNFDRPNMRKSFSPITEHTLEEKVSVFQAEEEEDGNFVAFVRRKCQNNTMLLQSQKKKYLG